MLRFFPSYKKAFFVLNWKGFTEDYEKGIAEERKNGWMENIENLFIDLKETLHQVTRFQGLMGIHSAQLC